MSVRVIGMVFEAGPVDPSLHGVMLALADNADDQGCAWPGVEVLAWKSRQSERNVLRLLKQLEELGWLAVRRRAFGPRRRGNVYQMNLEKLRPQAVAQRRVVVSRSSGDILSPDLSTRVANKATCKPSSDSMSPDAEGGGREVTIAAHEVTKTSSRGDKRAVPFNAFNRQEPSGTVNVPPLPLPGGGERVAVAEVGDGTGGGAARGKAADSRRPGDGLDRKAEAAVASLVESCATREAALAVMRDCAISDGRLQPVISGVLVAELGRGNAPEATAKRMANAWMEYLGDAELMRFQWGPRKFFAQGFWRNANSWPYDEKLLAQRRRANRSGG